MYLDPGFGSMAIQLIIACIAGGGTLLVLFRQRIKSFFFKNMKNNTNPGDTGSNDTNE